MKDFHFTSRQTTTGTNMTGREGLKNEVEVGAEAAVEAEVQVDTDAVLVEAEAEAEAEAPAEPGRIKRRDITIIQFVSI